MFAFGMVALRLANGRVWMLRRQPYDRNELTQVAGANPQVPETLVIGTPYCRGVALVDGCTTTLEPPHSRLSGAPLRATAANCLAQQDSFGKSGAPLPAHGNALRVRAPVASRVEHSGMSQTERN